MSTSDHGPMTKVDGAAGDHSRCVSMAEHRLALKERDEARDQVSALRLDLAELEQTRADLDAHKKAFIDATNAWSAQASERDRLRDAVERLEGEMEALERAHAALAEEAERTARHRDELQAELRAIKWAVRTMSGQPQ